MNTETYTLKQAMDKLGITSRLAFHHLKIKHPQAFVIVSTRSGRNDVSLYDKQMLDKFAQMREYSRKSQS